MLKTLSLESLKKNNYIKTVLVLALPAILENILQVLIGTVDMYFVSKIGEDAINGVGITNLIMNMYIAVFMALGIGTTAMVSRNIGAGDTKNANDTVKQSVILGVVVGLIFGLINFIFAKDILSLVGVKDQKAFEYAMPYFYTVAVPSVFLCVMLILSSALRGAGDTKTPLKIASSVNIINAILDFILIRGIGDFDGLGIVGAGLATTLARLIAVILLINKLRNKNNKINLIGKWNIKKNILKAITKISLPAATDKLIMRLGQIIYGGLILKIGKDAYAAHNIAGGIEAYSYLPGMGFGIAAATLVGQSLGGNKPKQAKKYGLIAYTLSTAFMIGVGIVFFIFAPLLARIFTQNDEIINQVVKVLRIIALFQPMLCVTLVVNSALQGAGDTKFPMYLTLLGIWGIRITGVLLLGIKLKLGLIGVWLAYALDITVRGTILMIRFLKGKWKNIQI